MIRDVQQYKLNPDLSITKNPFRYAKKQNSLKYYETALCPFCLKSYELSKFFLHKGLRICPNCGSKMKLSTLADITDFNRFVEFIFNYRFNGFWSKICLEVKPITSNTRFNEWNKRLYDLGLNKAFWDRYKELKGE